MKKFLLVLLLFPLWAAAQNIVQFTGGNYIFAEDGKLIFNIEYSDFESRNWVYDAKTDKVKTLFYQRMDFKTRNSSNFHAYEMAQVDQNGGRFQKAVYNPYANGGYRAQKVFWPVVWQGAVRLGGMFIPRFAARGIAACMANLTCRSWAASAAGHAAGLCALAYSGAVYNMPFGFCERAKEGGFEKNGKGEFERPAGGLSWEVQYYEYPCNGSCTPNQKIVYYDNQDAADFAKEQMADFYRQAKFSDCQPHERRYESGPYRGFVEAAGCQWHEFRIVPKEDKEPQPMTIVDIEDFVIKDIKKNPNDWANDKGEIGKKVREEIQPTRGDIDTKGGTLSIVGDVYRDNNGQAKQELINVDAPSDWQTPKAGGKVGEPSPGESTTSNNTSVVIKDRPDLESESKPSAGNDPNNGKGSGGKSGGSLGDGNSGKEGGGQEGKRCEAGSDRLECAQMGDVDQGQGFDIPGVEDGTTWKPDEFLPRGGTCPAPRVVSLILVNRTYEIKYDPICDFASKIRGLVVGFAVLTAGFIMFGRRSG